MKTNATLRSLLLLASALCSSFPVSLFAGSATYQYDAIGRLKSVTYADGTVITFSLDAAGNRTTVTSSTLPAGTLQFTAGTHNAGEVAGQRVVTIFVSRTSGSANAVAVTYATEDGSATVAGGDYTPTSGQLQWAPAETGNKSFTVTVSDDASYEGSESFAVRLSSPTGSATLGSPFVATINIADDETPPRGVLALSSSVYSATENGGNFTVTVNRTGGSFGAAGVQYANQTNGTAVLGTDYNAFSGGLNWQDAEAGPKTFVIPVLDDAVFDGPKSINLAISSASGASLGTPNTSTLNVSDNEVAQPGVISLSPNSYIVSEAAGTATVFIARTGGTDNALDVGYSATSGSATDGADFNGTSGLLHWNSGETGSKSFTVQILEDDVLESTETIALSITSIIGGATSGTTTGTITINDNETLGSIQFLSANYSVTEGPGATVSLQVARQVNATGAASVLVSVPGYLSNHQVNWANGQLGAQTVVVTIGDDVFANGTRNVAASLSNVSGASYGANPTATITITDDEPSLTVSIDNPAVAMEGAPVSFRVYVNHRTTVPVTVNYASNSGTATQGQDYTGVSGQLTIPQQAWDTNIVVPTTDDPTVESTTETFTVTLSNPTVGTLGTATGTGTIQDNESPTPSVPGTMSRNQVGTSPNFTMLWGASTGTANHYTINETGPAGVANYHTTGPVTQYAFAKGNGGTRVFQYKVQACATADQSLCSALTPNPYFVTVCTGPNCN